MSLNNLENFRPKCVAIRTNDVDIAMNAKAEVKQMTCKLNIEHLA